MLVAAHFAGRAAPQLEVRLNATRREPASGNAPPEYGAVDTGSTNEWCGCNGASLAHAVGFREVRTEPGACAWPRPSPMARREYRLR